jgi:molybdate transport system substrate-binding protein
MRIVRIVRRVTPVLATCIGLTTALGGSQTPAIRVIGSPAVRGVIDDLGRQFERETGQRVVAEYEVFAVVKRRIERGEPFDVSVLSPAITEELISQLLLVGESRFDLGRHGVALGARRGVPLPDISTAAALSATIRKASSVGYVNEGTAGAHFLAVAERLGLSADISRVARGFDLAGLQQELDAGHIQYVAAGLAMLRALPGIGEANLLPRDLQQYTTYTAAVSTGSTLPDGARAFVTFMSMPGARATIARHGLEAVPR